MAAPSRRRAPVRAVAGRVVATVVRMDARRAVATAARAVAVQPLLEQGFQGAELGEALNRQRLQALKTYKADAAL